MPLPPTRPHRSSAASPSAAEADRPPGAWTGVGNTYTYQWQRSADGATWTAITGATTRIYTLTSADEGDFVRMLVTSTNPAATVSQGSQPTSAVLAAPPISTTGLSISGTTKAGFKLTAALGTWTGIGNSYSYQWQRSSDRSTWTAITGATAKTYVLASADVGDYVRVLVTATNPDATVALPSTPTAEIGSAGKASAQLAGRPRVRSARAGDTTGHGATERTGRSA